ESRFTPRNFVKNYFQKKLHLSQAKNMVSRLSPELLQGIFKNLYTLYPSNDSEYKPPSDESDVLNDYYIYHDEHAYRGYLRDLFNCILVNRYWCKNAIYLIWQEPFNFRNITKYKDIIQIYYCLLPFETRLMLRDNSGVVPIKLKKFQKPLLNYASFLKKLNFINLYHAVDVWTLHYTVRVRGASIDYEFDVEENEDHDGGERDDNYEDENNNEFLEVCDDDRESEGEVTADECDECELLSLRERRIHSKIAVFRELCVLFDSRCGNLKYYIEFEAYRDFIPSLNRHGGEYRHDTFTFLQDLSKILPSRIRLETLECFTWWEPKIFEELSKVFSSIGFMEIHCKSEDNLGLATLINTVDMISQLTIYQTRWAVPNITSAVKKKMSEITEFHIIGGGSIPLSILSEGKDLKVFGMWQETDELQDFYVKNLRGNNDDESPYVDIDEEALLPLVKFTYFKELTNLSLDITFTICYQRMSTIIKNTNGNLTSLGIVWWSVESDPDNAQSFFTTIANSCPHLIRLELTILASNIDYLQIILRSCKHLKSIEFRGWTNLDISQSIQKIGENLPKDLEHLVFDKDFICISSALKNFLKHCHEKNIVGLMLLFRNGVSWLTEHINIMNTYIDLGVLHPNTHLSWNCVYNEDGTKSISEE
ncbi:9136_t:CDS:1, partial [Acaulospora morrowiae]